jgi:hypothetical protein
MQTAIVLLLILGATGPDSTVQEFKKKNPAVALSLSLLPGGGQFYTENYWKGVVFAGAQSYFGGGAVYLHLKARDAEQKQYESWEYDYDWYSTQRTNFLWWSALTWAIAMSDAYVSAHFYKFKEQGTIQFDVGSLLPVQEVPGSVQRALDSRVSMSISVAF